MLSHQQWVCMYWTTHSLPHSPPHIDTLRSAPVRPVSWWERKWTHLGSHHLHLWEEHHLLSTDRWGLDPELVLSERHADGPSNSILVGGLFLLKATQWLRKYKMINWHRNMWIGISFCMLQLVGGAWGSIFAIFTRWVQHYFSLRLSLCETLDPLYCPSTCMCFFRNDSF